MKIPFVRHICFLIIFIPAGITFGKDKPNILWLSTEDIGPHLGCYGDALAHTPRLDSLADRGIRYTNAYTVAGVCAPNRSAIITGIYQTTLGTHHMRSGGDGVEGSTDPKLPESIHFLPEYLRNAGYYCTNNWKKDYNTPTQKNAWNESSMKAHWENRKDESQPFFAVFNYIDTHEGSVRSTGEEFRIKTINLKDSERQNTDQNIPPPFHPDTPIVRENWAKYRELITGLDYWVGEHLDALSEANLVDDTIVFFWSDHGPGLPRCKRWLYDSGTHIPLIVYIPDKYRQELMPPPGSTDPRLVSSIDLPATVLRLCGLDIPTHMQGQPFLDTRAAEPRSYVYGARDRMDDRYDIIRMVRDHRFKYIRNYEPFKPYDQHMKTAELSPVKQELHRVQHEDNLTEGQAWFTREEKPKEELFDTTRDPHELENLANLENHNLVLEKMRRVHQNWMLETRDLGLIPEPELVRLENQFGTRYQIAQGLEKQHPGFFQELMDISNVAGRPRNSDMPTLLSALEHPQPSIRYWGTVGLGLLGEKINSVVVALENSLQDSSPTVRVAAARSCFRLGSNEPQAFETLRKMLQHNQEWVRLRAAIALDEIGEKARPAVPDLHEALNDKHNKYIVRVANHALNELENTDRRVP